MKFAAILCIAFLTLLSTAQAGDKKRNGGTLLRCGNSLQVLDLYESENSYGLEMSHFTGDNYVQVLEKVFSRLDRHNPKRANLYREYLKNFPKEGRFIAGSKFTDIPDLGAGVPYPKDCDIVQAVAQFRQITPQGLRYLINQDLWMQLDPTQQAALALHEFVYREAYEDNEQIESSRGVRYFTGYLFSTSAEQDTLKSYIENLKNSDLVTAEYRDITFIIRENEKVVETVFADDNSIRVARLARSFSLDTSSRLKNIKCISDNSGDRINVTFDGDSRTITANCMMYVPLKDEFGGSGYTLTSFINLTETGKINKLLVAKTPSGKDDVIAIQYIRPNMQFFSASSNVSQMFFSENENLARVSFQILSQIGLDYTTYNFNGRESVFRIGNNYEILITPSGQDNSAQTH